MSLVRTRWAAIGAAVAVVLGAGGVGFVAATSPSGATAFVAITPCRVIDTRPDFQVGPRATPLGADETYTVGTHGSNGECTDIPSDAVAVSLNVTTTDASRPTFLTLWANGAAKPNASSLNPSPGAPPSPNAVTTEVSADGEFDIYNFAGTVHVLADINGYYVDHDHDDRYYRQDQLYTRAEVDAAISDAVATAGGAVGPRSVSLDPAGFFLDNGAVYARNGLGANRPGVRLPDSGTQPLVTFHVTLPADFTTGGEPVIDLYWRIDEVGCSAVLDWVPTLGSRLGQAGFSVAAVDVPYVKIGSIAVDEVRRTSIRVSAGGSGLRAGDTITAGVFRQIDSCTGAILLEGGRLTYS